MLLKQSREPRRAGSTSPNPLHSQNRIGNPGVRVGGGHDTQLRQRELKCPAHPWGQHSQLVLAGEHGLGHRKLQCHGSAGHILPNAAHHVKRLCGGG